MSTPSKVPFFGRAWSLSITPNQGPAAGNEIIITSDSFEPESLRMTFDVVQLAFSAFWQAEIAIWNANGPISSGPSEGINLYQAIIQEGDVVTLKAGYQADGSPPIIFTGPIFYTIQDRVDVVDQRLIIHCLLNRVLTTQNFLNATVPALSTQFTQAQFIASKSINPIQVNGQLLQNNIAGASPQRGAAQLPRGKSYFGNPHHYLKAIADQNSLLSWFDNTHWNTHNLQQVVGDVKANYAPLTLLGGPPLTDGITKLTLVGQPQQTQFGVSFRVLLDPTVQVTAPLPQVGLQMQYVRQAPIQYPLPANQLAPRPLTSKFVVVGVRFTGDTRGNPWYSEITGITQVNDIIQLLGNTSQADATRS